jgi:hypothetical protein
MESISPVVKSWKSKINDDGVEKRFFEVVVSGIKEDRDGEVMDQAAVDDMIMQFKSGKVPLMPDHGVKGETRHYSWKDMMGVWVDARQEGDNLIAVARLNDAHPDADVLWGYLDEKMPVGFSIGAKVINYTDEVIDGTN